MVEYIVAIDVTRVRFPADATSEAGEAGARSHRANRWAESVITVSPTGTLWGGGRGTGSVHTVGVPGALRAAPHFRESPVVVVPVTFRDPVMV